MKTEYTEKQFRKLLISENIYNFNYGGFDNKKCQSKSKCPIFEDFIPYKSWTIIVDKKKFNSAMYWCDYIHGGNSVSKTKELDKNKVAIRSDYQCW